MSTLDLSEIVNPKSKYHIKRQEIILVYERLIYIHRDEIFWSRLKDERNPYELGSKELYLGGAKLEIENVSLEPFLSF